MSKDNSFKEYTKIDKNNIKYILTNMKEKGLVITGNNPWHVETGSHGVKLKGEWDEKSLILTISIIEKAWYVSNSDIWKKLNDISNEH